MSACIERLADRFAQCGNSDHLQPVWCGFWRYAAPWCGNDGAREAVSRRFAEATPETRHRSQLTKESNLTDRHRLATDRTIALRRSEGEGEREVERRLVQDDAANQICVDVAVADRNASAATEYRGEESEARRIESASGATWCTEGGASDERLHLNQQRAAPLKKRSDHRSWGTRLTIINEGTPRIVNTGEAVLPHLEEAELIR
jgi:hypothetical protein